MRFRGWQGGRVAGRNEVVRWAEGRQHCGLKECGGLIGSCAGGICGNEDVGIHELRNADLCSEIAAFMDQCIQATSQAMLARWMPIITTPSSIDAWRK